MSNVFADKLISWGEGVQRNMPWKDTQDPYKIWLSEIILQQTRVEQGLPYYLKFTETFPKVENLASAPEDQVLRLWQGLGYYSRARNLHYSAKYIVNELDGVFPNTYEEIIKLKGVGDYTASAISSFAFGACHPVLDGNVARVISRVWGIVEPIDHSSTIKKIKAILHDVIDCQAPAKFNQAIMDFGATFCTPKNPQCGDCMFQNSCLAIKTSSVGEIPYKSKKIVRRKRYFHYLKVINREDEVAILKRPNKDIWEGLYEYILVEKPSTTDLTKLEIHQKMENSFAVGSKDIEHVSTQKLKKHLLTHQEIFVTVYEILIKGKYEKIPSNAVIVHSNSLSKFAFPRILTKMI